MNHFLEIRIRKDPDFSVQNLMNILFRKLHRVLVKINSRGIGVSFPEHNLQNLGSVLRLHGSSGALNRIMAEDWLRGMMDHVQISSLMSVPPNTKFRTVRRVQAKSSPERLRRRAMKRHGIDQAEANARIPDSAAESLKLPYIKLASGSTGQQFPIFVKHGSLKDEPAEGPFSSYGFSETATIPWF